MRAKLIIIIAILVAAFSCPAQAQVKVKLNVKGLLNTVVKEAEKAAERKKEKEKEQAKEGELTSEKAGMTATEKTEATATEKTEAKATEKPQTPITYEKLIVPLYSGSEIWNDHKIGFEEMSVIINDSTVRNVEGYIRRVFSVAPAGRSALEVVRNYENAFKESGWSILFKTRKPQAIVINGKKISDIFTKHRRELGISSSQSKLPASATEFLSGKLSTTDKDIYIMIAIGPGDWTTSLAQRIVYELVTIETEPMAMGMVTAAAIGEGLSTLGRIPIYDIFFDTGQSEVKPESADALKAIAEYLNANETQKVVIVGHTDNVGDFDMNITLSQERANAVMEKLISEYGVSREQLKPFGVGPVSPIASNSTEEGKAQNRRVEIVEQ